MNVPSGHHRGALPHTRTHQGRLERTHDGTGFLNAVPPAAGWGRTRSGRGRAPPSWRPRGSWRCRRRALCASWASTSTCAPPRWCGRPCISIDEIGGNSSCFVRSSVSLRGPQVLGSMRSDRGKARPSKVHADCQQCIFAQLSPCKAGRHRLVCVCKWSATLTTAQCAELAGDAGRAACRLY